MCNQDFTFKPITVREPPQEASARGWPRLPCTLRRLGQSSVVKTQIPSPTRLASRRIDRERCRRSESGRSAPAPEPLASDQTDRDDARAADPPESLAPC